MSPEELCEFRLECLKLAQAGMEHDPVLGFARAQTPQEAVARADAYVAFVMGEHEKRPTPIESVRSLANYPKTKNSAA